MDRKLRIAVADDEHDMREYFTRILPRLGHEVVAVAENGQQLVEACRGHKPDLAITDIKMPEMDGIEAAEAIYEEHPLPIILVSAFPDPEFIKRAEADHVLGYLVKPIKHSDLAPAIALTMKRFAQFQELLGEVSSLRQALENRKTIERAKGILMKRAHLDENDAFRRLQKMASEKNLKLAELASMILTAEQAYSSA